MKDLLSSRKPHQLELQSTAIVAELHRPTERTPELTRPRSPRQSTLESSIVVPATRTHVPCETFQQPIDIASRRYLDHGRQLLVVGQQSLDLSSTSVTAHITSIGNSTTYGPASSAPVAGSGWKWTGSTNINNPTTTLQFLVTFPSNPPYGFTAASITCTLSTTALVNYGIAIEYYSVSAGAWVVLESWPASATAISYTTSLTIPVADLPRSSSSFVQVSGYGNPVTHWFMDRIGSLNHCHSHHLGLIANRVDHMLWSIAGRVPVTSSITRSRSNTRAEPLGHRSLGCIARCCGQSSHGGLGAPDHANTRLGANHGRQQLTVAGDALGQRPLVHDTLPWRHLLVRHHGVGLVVHQ